MERSITFLYLPNITTLFQINGSDLTNAWHEEAVRLLKQFGTDTDIVLVLYREDVYYTQPPIPVQDPEEQYNGHISVNTNANNSVGSRTFASPPEIEFVDEDVNEDARYPMEVSSLIISKSWLCEHTDFL